MDLFVILIVVGVVGLTSGAGLIAMSVRRAGWRGRVAQWLGVGSGVALVVVGATAGVVAFAGGRDLSAPGRPTVEDMSRPVEGFEYRLVADDGEVRLEDHRGSVVLLNLWATWCPPCVVELPYLNRVQAEYGDRGVVVITLSEEARDRLQAFGERYPRTTVDAYVPDAGTLPRPFQRGFRALPTTYVIDRAGYIRGYRAGAMSYEEFADMVRPLL